MSYFTKESELASRGITFDEQHGQPPPRGCVEPTRSYGATPGVGRFEDAVSDGILQRIPEVEWPEWIEKRERAKAGIPYRIEKDWKEEIYQGRCGFCWSYSVIGAMQARAAITGRPYTPLSAASVAAQIKGGRDQGGWPVDAAAWIAERGVCELEIWGNCNCSGSSCKGPRSGCPARDLSQVESTQFAAKVNRIETYFEIPRDDMEAAVSCVLQDIPVAAGWVGHRNLWCDGHAMNTVDVIRTSRRGYQIIPRNSWGDYKLTVPVSEPPTGGVAIVSTRVAA